MKCGSGLIVRLTAGYLGYGEFPATSKHVNLAANADDQSHQKLYVHWVTQRLKRQRRKRSAVPPGLLYAPVQAPRRSESRIACENALRSSEEATCLQRTYRAHQM